MVKAKLKNKIMSPYIMPDTDFHTSLQMTKHDRAEYLSNALKLYKYTTTLTALTQDYTQVKLVLYVSSDSYSCT